MPISAQRPCATPGCPALVRGAPRCPACTLEAGVKDRARRGSSHARGYDARWRARREAHLRANPLCAMCLAATPPRVTAATVGDHKIGWRTGKTEAERQRLFDDDANLQSLCASCHGIKTAAEDGSFGRLPQ